MGTHVLVIEDHELLAESLRLALVAEGMSVSVPRIEVDGILALVVAQPPDVVLLDLDLGSDMVDGSMLVEPLVLGGARVVVMSGSSDATRVAGCIESGAHGYVPKTRPLQELLDAVRAAAAGEPVMAEPVRLDMLADLRKVRARRRQQLAPFTSLTDREAVVLSRIMSGSSVADIAQDEFVSEATVRTQIRAILTKLDVHSQLAAVAEAQRVGWHLPAGSVEARVVNGN
jgi:DNA-binding NarL/FixJ family response regulator